MKFKLIIIISLSFLIAINLFGQIISPKHNLQLNVDLTRFFGDESNVLLETYYSFRTDELSYISNDGMFSGGINISVEIKQGENVLEKDNWTVPSTATDSAIVTIGKTLVGVRKYFLKSGEYDFKIIAIDINNKDRVDSLRFPINISLFPTDREAISDIEICSSIKQIPKDENNIFYKNTLEVIPNASLLFGPGLPILYYYLEGYNLLQKESSEEYMLKTSVLDATGKEIITHEKNKKRVNNSSVEIGTINTTSLKGGTYTLKISISDTVRRTAAVSMKRFFIYKPGQIDSLRTLSSGGMVSSEYALMFGSDVQEEYELLSYIITDAEKKQFGKLTELDAKRKFLYDFWKRRDIDPSTTINEFKEEYMQRVEYVKQTYSASFKKGWKTDRGRVYIVYGPPDDIERYPSSYDAEPYEIWNYNSIQNGVIFIFIDRAGQGDYRLGHSNHRNELQDENWYNQIKKAR
ncbi:MAG: GWxTD domain-containing protein [Bacteroidota bacterium]|nr:GWxTD domain-containing protein [Bacteroidota bacterium]